MHHGHGIINGVLPSGDTLLNSLILEGYTTTAINLVTNGADVNVKGTIDNKSPLHCIFECQKFVELANRKDVLMTLLNNVEDVNVEDDKGFMPLHAACIHSDTNTVEELLKHGAQVNPSVKKNKNRFSIPPLLWAIKHGRADIAVLLVDYGADVDGVSSLNGWSALCEAIMEDVNIAHMLLDRGASVISQSSRVTAFELVLMRHNCGLFNRMVDIALSAMKWNASPATNDILQRTIKSGCQKCLIKVLDSGISVNKFLGKNYQYPIFMALVNNFGTVGSFHSAVQLTSGAIGMAKLLIDRGAHLGDLWEKVIWNIQACYMWQQDIDAFSLCIKAFGFGPSYNTKLDCFFRKIGINNNNESFKSLLGLIYMAGYTPTEEAATIVKSRKSDIKLPCLHNRDEEDIAIWSDDIRRYPRSLTNICVVSIRQNLRDNIICSSKALALPDRLTDLITLETYW